MSTRYHQQPSMAVETRANPEPRASAVTPKFLIDEPSSESSSEPLDGMLRACNAAIQAMAAGKFRVDIPGGDHAGLAVLGQALGALGATLEQRFGEMTKLSALTERINAGKSVEEVLEYAFESFHTILPYDRLGVSFLEDDGRTVRAAWARSSVPQLKIQAGYSAPLAGSSLEQIIQSGRPRVINDLEAYLESHPESQATRLIVAEGIRSSLTCPLIASGRAVGFMFFSSRERFVYSDAHVELFVRLANHLSLIVEKSRLFRDLEATKTKLEAATNRLAELATTDGLTSIPNRRALDERLSKAWLAAVRHRRPLALLMIDIDHFKEVNDRFGHLHGDQCLQSIASELRSALRRPEDFVGRFGGEEFLVIAEMTELGGAVQLGEMLRTRVGALALPEGSVTVSVGVAACCPTRSGRVEQLLARADEALYQAKQRGRNRVVAHFEEKA